MADNSLPKVAERSLPDAAMANVTHVRVVSTDNSEKLPIENLTLAGTKVTVAVDGLSGTVDGAFEDVLIQIAEKENASNKKTVLNDSDTEFPTSKAVKTANDLKLDANKVSQEVGTSTVNVPSENAVRSSLGTQKRRFC